MEYLSRLPNVICVILFLSKYQLNSYLFLNWFHFTASCNISMFSNCRHSSWDNFSKNSNPGLWQTKPFLFSSKTSLMVFTKFYRHIFSRSSNDCFQLPKAYWQNSSNVKRIYCTSESTVNTAKTLFQDMNEIHDTNE